MKVDKYTATIITIARPWPCCSSRPTAHRQRHTRLGCRSGPFSARPTACCGPCPADHRCLGAKALKGDNRFAMIPMWFMLVTTVAALGIMIKDNMAYENPKYVLVVPSIVLLVLPC